MVSCAPAPLTLLNLSLCPLQCPGQFHDFWPLLAVRTSSGLKHQHPSCVKSLSLVGKKKQPAHRKLCLSSPASLEWEVPRSSCCVHLPSVEWTDFASHPTTRGPRVHLSHRAGVGSHRGSSAAHNSCPALPFNLCDHMCGGPRSSPVSSRLGETMMGSVVSL